MSENESMELVVDFSEAVSFEPLSVGWYGVTVVEAKGGQSQAGNHKLSLRLEVTSADDADSMGRKLYDDLVLEGKGTWKTRQAFDAFFGGTEGEQMRINTSDLLGCEAEVRVVQKVWREEDGGDGEARSRIIRYRASKMESGDAESLKSMFDD